MSAYIGRLYIYQSQLDLVQKDGHSLNFISLNGFYY